MDVTAWLLDSDPALRWQVMRDLLNVQAAGLTAERARVAHEGWGAHLLSLQWDDGSWEGGAHFPGDFSEEMWRKEGQPWTSTSHVLLELRAFGVDPSDLRVAAAVDRVANGVRWEYAGERYFDGEVEPCINGHTVAIGAYFGHDVAAIVERLLGERLPDGGWNCEAPHNSDVTSFDTTICVLDGLGEFTREVGPDPRIDEAISGALEYYYERGLFRRLRSGEVADPQFLDLSFPHRFHYDTLRMLDWLRANGHPPDPRAAEAVAHLRDMRREDETWALQRSFRGRRHLDFGESVGEASRWNTLRALRVLRWWDGN